MPEPSKVAHVSCHCLIIGMWQTNHHVASNYGAKGTCFHALWLFLACNACLRKQCGVLTTRQASGAEVTPVNLVQADVCEP